MFFKKGFSKISKNPQKNTCAGVSFSIKLQASSLKLYKKNRLWYNFFCRFCEILNSFFIGLFQASVSAIAYFDLIQRVISVM